MIDPDVFGDLVRARRWVAWKEEERGGRVTKVPINPLTGAYASSTDPATWATLEEARYHADERGLAGVGIVLGDGLGGVDLDACRDPETGQVAPWAQRVIDGFRSYTEVSPSGTGVKIYAFGAPAKLPASTYPIDGGLINGKRPAIEAYTSGRYFAVTGEVLEGAPDEIRDCGELGDGWDRLLRLLRKRSSGDPEREELELTGNAELSEALRNVLEGSGKAAGLWAEGKGGGADRSVNDAALAGTLGAMGFSGEDVEAALRAYPLGQVGSGKLTGKDADRQLSRLLGIAVKAREGREEEPTLTDTGNASRLVALHGPRLHYVPTWGKWVLDEEGFWTLDHKDVQIRELAKDVGLRLRDEALEKLRQTASKKEAAPWKERLGFALKSLDAKRIRDMVDLARGVEGIPLDHEALDADGWLLGVGNGVVELRTGRYREAGAGDLMTMRSPVPWDEEATAPRWAKALQEWFPDPDVRSYVGRLAGAALVGEQRDHVFVVHYGLGGNGKGTFLRALQRVLGPYAVEIHLSLLVETRHKEHDTVKADLFRTRLAVAVETERRVKLAEASVKNLTGGDRIRARRMREDPWSFDPTHSLWLQTNHLPEIAGRDEGIWRRIRVVKWENSFRGREADPTLDDTLANEAPGILRWLVEGCLEWQEHGLDEPEGVIRATLAYRQKEDTFSRFQADTGLTFRRDLQMEAKELQELLTTWANEEGVDAPTQEIGDWLREHECRKTQVRVTGPDGKQRRPRAWIGVGIEDAGHETEQTDALA